MKDYSKEIKVNKAFLLLSNILCVVLVAGFLIDCLTGNNSLSNFKDITVSAVLYLLIADTFRSKIDILELKRDLEK